MNKIITKIIVTSMLFAIFFVSMKHIVLAQNLDLEDSIHTLVQSISEKDWETYKNLMSYEEVDFYDWYFNDDEYTDGVKQIKSIELEKVFSLNDIQMQKEVLYEDFQVLSNTSDIKAFLVELNCDVTKENVYFQNGINYYLIVFAQETDGTYKIAQFSKPSYDLLEQVIKPNLKSADENYENEISALKIAYYAEQGVVTNSDEEIITDGYNVMMENKKNGEIVNYNEYKSVQTYASNNYSDHPALKAWLYYSYPSNITVYCNKSGDANGKKKVVKVKLQDYIKNTLPNEWYTSWDSDSLKAGALCVKGVAIYRSIKPVNANYMVTQYTQNYIPKSSKATTNTAVNSVSDYFVVNSEDKIFFPEYGAGTKGKAGTKSSGRLLQWGSQYLAQNNDYTYKQILNYYYKGSACSKGSLKYINIASV